MFYVDGTTINLSRGDTGSVTIGTDGYDFDAEDRALFTLKNSLGELIMENQYELENGQFTIQFRNADTDSLPVGMYSWDVRFILNPLYDSERRTLSGQPKIIDGDQVITPDAPMSLNILGTIGEV